MNEENKLQVVKSLVPVNTQSCNEILDWAREQNFETVMIIGMKDEKIYYQRSMIDSTAMFLGLMEMTKIDMVANDR